MSNTTTEHAAADAPKKSMKMVIIIVVALLVLGGGGAGGYFYLKGGKASASESDKEHDKEKGKEEKGEKEGKEKEKKKHADDDDEQAKEDKDDEEEEDKDETSDHEGESEHEKKSKSKSKSTPIKFPDDSDVKQVIELQPYIVNLADKDQARYLRMTVSVGVGEGGEEKPSPVFTTRVRNALLAVLTTKTSDEVLTTEGKAALRKELLKAARAVSKEPKVQAIYITEFIVQL